MTGVGRSEFTRDLVVEPLFPEDRGMLVCLFVFVLELDSAEAQELDSALWIAALDRSL